MVLICLCVNGRQRKASFTLKAAFGPEKTSGNGFSAKLSQLVLFLLTVHGTMSRLLIDLIKSSTMSDVGSVKRPFNWIFPAILLHRCNVAYRLRDVVAGCELLKHQLQ